MNKKEKIRLLIGILVLTVLFCAVAMIGWTKEDFTIFYYYGFDGKYETQTVKKGYVKEPLDPGRYGYIFDGWYYTDKQGNEILFDFESERVTTDLELTAHWVPFETEVVFRPNGGECEVESMMVPYGSEIVMPTAERKGYYFVGWATGVLIAPEKFIWDDLNENGRVSFSACWSKFKPGTTYFIGEYEQIPIYEKGELIGWEKKPIEWIPIDKKDGKYLLVSKYTLDVGSLGRADGKAGYVHWADCELRKWLNGDFYNQAFSEAEKNMICDFTDDSLGTTDRVSLLSIEEAKLLVGLDTFGIGTVYANEKGLDDGKSYAEMKIDGVVTRYYPYLSRSFNNYKNWDLSDALSSTSARTLSGIRPAIWVDASKLSGR